MSLRSLSDSEFLSGIHKAVANEQTSTLQVLLYLNEMQRRRLHLQAGYSSLFDYCTSVFKYSASAAIRRIRSARCIACYPLAGELLKAKEVNLSTLAMVLRVLNDGNHAQVLERIRNRSQKDVQAIVAEFHPVAKLPDRVRTVVLRVSKSADPPVESTLSLSAPGTELACEKSDYNRSGCADAGVEPASTPQYEKRAFVQFAARPEFMKKLERIKSLAWHRLGPNASLEQIFELGMDAFLEREDPDRRIERRKESKPARWRDRERLAAYPGGRARHGISTRWRKVRVCGYDGKALQFCGCPAGGSQVAVRTRRGEYAPQSETALRVSQPA